MLERLFKDIAGAVRQLEGTTGALLTDVKVLQQGELVQRQHGASIKELDERCESLKVSVGECVQRAE
eukprot:2332935-Prymnesium_polylepis.1